MRAQIRYDAGHGVAVAFVPGIDGTGEYLLGTAPRISARFRLLTFRYPEGRPPAAEQDSYRDLARRVAEALAEREARPALILADSFGSGVALQLALDNPRMIAGLMLVNGFARYPARLRLGLSRIGAHLPVGALYRALRPHCVTPLLFGRREDARAVADFLAIPSAVMTPGYRRRLRMIQRLDLRARLGELRQPVALYASDRDRIVPSLRAARVMESALPDATFQVLEGAGHVVLPLEAEPWVERLETLARRAGLA